MERYERYFKYATFAVLIFIITAFIIAAVANISLSRRQVREGTAIERATGIGGERTTTPARRRAEGTALFMLVLLVILSLIAIYVSFLYGRKCSPRAPLLELVKLERMVPLKINLTEMIESAGETWLVKATAEMAIEPSKAHITKDENRRLFAMVSLPAPELEAPQIIEARKLNCDPSGNVTMGEPAKDVPDSIRTKVMAQLALAVDTDENDSIMRKTVEDIIEAAFDSTGWIAEFKWQDEHKQA